jgi:hypothetical protein
MVTDLGGDLNQAFLGEVGGIAGVACTENQTVGAEVLFDALLGDGGNTCWMKWGLRHK